MISNSDEAMVKGNEFKKSGDLEKASEMYEKALSLSPDNIDIMKLYANSLKDLKYYSLAAKVSIKMIERQPKNE